MTFNYFVSAKKRDLAPIYIRFVAGRGADLIVSTLLHVNPLEWDQKRQTLRKRILTDADNIFLARLKGLKDLVESETRIYTGPRTKEWLSSLVSKYHNIKENKADTLNGYIDDFIKKAEAGELKNKGAINFVPGTIRKFKGFQRLFNMYQGIYTDKDRAKYLKENKPLRPLKIVDFSDITSSFNNDFVAWLSNENYKVNTIGRFVKELKYFMRMSLDDEKHDNRAFEKFRIYTERTHAIYLNTDEIQKIYGYKDPDIQIQFARDAYVVLCDTALRVSDYQKIDVSIKGDFIRIYTQKTGREVIIPVTQRVKEIMARYDNKLPRIPDQYINKYIKTIAFRVGLTESITYPVQENGKKKMVSVPKYKLVTCHTARRSAVTNMLKAKISPALIMGITGHTTERQLFEYARLTKEEIAHELSLDPYFKLKVV